ncbi:hypothetical protein KPZU09_16550 [Klebsiella pneumoniae]|uniref:Uncharacterized protein n=1 Tax=Klebsiella pneumoniae TaxID=573 RepID=A0A919HTH2_KLEPN|nr:hypothetical protein KPZU09_16550 [Klebsiella pneumoniae]
MGLAALLKAGRVRKMICSFPRRWIPRFSMISTVAAKWSWSWCRRATSRRGSGGRRRAGGGIYPTGYGTPLAEGKETREIDGRHYVLEYPIKADFALIKAHRGDRWGNWSIARRRATLARSWRQRRKPPS